MQTKTPTTPPEVFLDETYWADYARIQFEGDLEAINRCLKAFQGRGNLSQIEGLDIINVANQGSVQRTLKSQ